MTTEVNVLELFNEGQAAKALGCSVALLRKMRLLREGPTFVKLGRLVRYSAADLAQYVAANRVEPAGGER